MKFRFSAASRKPTASTTAATLSGISFEWTTLLAVRLLFEFLQRLLPSLIRLSRSDLNCCRDPFELVLLGVILVRYHNSADAPIALRGTAKSRDPKFIH